MIFPDGTPDDLTNYHLRTEALSAQERGDEFAVWHGRDITTGEDVELFINLTDHTGAMALGRRAILPGRFGEDGETVVMRFKDPGKGSVSLDLDSEELRLGAERVGVEYAPGEDPKLRLYDRLTGDTVMETEGDAFHELVDTKVLDPKDYPGSGVKYLQSIGIA